MTFFHQWKDYGFRRACKYQKQRIVRGFDDTDLWNLDMTIARFVAPRLRVFQEITVSCPIELIEGENYTKGHELWAHLLGSMVWGLEMVAEGKHNDNAEDNQLVQVQLERFGKYFTNLWD